MSGSNMEPRGGASAIMARHNEAQAGATQGTTTSGAGLTLRPGNTDVLLGRGRGRLMHPGNLRYEGLILRFLGKYLNSARNGKREISNGIVNLIMQNGMQNGRFLKPIGPNQWEAISKAEALLKVAQCFQYHKRRLAARTSTSAIGQFPNDDSSSSDGEPEDFDDAPEDSVAHVLQLSVYDDVEELVVDPLPHDFVLHPWLPHQIIDKAPGTTWIDPPVPCLKDLLCRPGNFMTIQNRGNNEKDSHAMLSFAADHFKNSIVDFEPIENWPLLTETASELCQYFDSSTTIFP